MTPNSLVLDRHDIDQRREELLKRAGMPLASLRERAERYELDLTQQAILRRLEELEFLAGH